MATFALFEINCDFLGELTDTDPTAVVEALASIGRNPISAQRTLEYYQLDRSIRYVGNSMDRFTLVRRDTVAGRPTDQAVGSMMADECARAPDDVVRTFHRYVTNMVPPRAGKSETVVAAGNREQDKAGNVCMQTKPPDDLDTKQQAELDEVFSAPTVPAYDKVHEEQFKKMLAYFMLTQEEFESLSSDAQHRLIDRHDWATNGDEAFIKSMGALPGVKVIR